MEKGQTGMSFFWIEDSNEEIPSSTKMMRKVKRNKMEFVGWASKPLIEFLKSNNKDYSKQLSQYDVAAIINEYVRTHNLIHSVKKKRIICDEWLYSLFGKKSVLRNKIYDLLSEHFAENHDSSEDDLINSSEDEDIVGRSSSKKRKILYEKKQAPGRPKSCFAAIVPENIKLLYLKRSLVQNLLDNTETFEGKVVGSYVRIKSDPNDCSQKHSHLLLPVTGLCESGVGKEILLQVPNVIKPIPVHMLSEENFSEEECEDLRQRVKDGLIRRPTVVEFEQKARFLHEDITKHDGRSIFQDTRKVNYISKWLQKELNLLRNLMDRANEKGWRREYYTKYEYSERIQLLESPAEKTRLLLEVPKVIADELEVDPTLQEPIENEKQGMSISPTSIADALEPDPTLPVPLNNAKGGISNSPKSIIRGASFNSADSGVNQPISSLSPNVEVAAIPSQDTTNDFPVNSKGKTTSTNGITSHVISNGMQAALKAYKQQKLIEAKPASVVQQQNGLCISTTIKNSIGRQVTWSIEANGTQKEEEKKVPLVIELSDDDDDEDTKPTSTSTSTLTPIPTPTLIPTLTPTATPTEDVGFQLRILEHPESAIWHYMDPQGKEQGPFPMTALKAWYDGHYFHPDFKVWKRGQLPGQAVLLRDLLHDMFSN